jgi:Uma2 family endonuclease
MNIQSKMPTTADEFLRWNEGREGKREFVRGKVVEMMINATKRHVVLAGRLVAILLRHLPYPAYAVGSADFGIKTPDGVRFPDVFVDKETEDSKDSDLAARHPVLLAEVLSASSVGRDFIEKLADYTGIPSLLHYLILSQDEPRVWLWTREGAAEWSGPREISGDEDMIELTGFGIELSMAELYAGIGR